MASMTPISVPFLPISYLCAIVSYFGNRQFQSILGYFNVTAQWKLMTIAYNLR